MNGALFYKADLHIHSYGQGTGSYDVTDITNTPQAIVEMAISKGIKIISITDHNEIMNSFTAITYAHDKDILVIPGIEVSSTQGHLLLYFETFEQLRQFHGKLSFNADKTTCNNGIVECLHKASESNGIGVLAHITLGSGFEQTIGRFGPQMTEIFKCSNLLGLEITNKDDAELYTDNDNSAEHKQLLNVWREAMDNKLHRDFAKLMSSDSHELAKLGQNADGNNRLTRIKMSSLNFRSFKLALLSSESRVRLEDYIPDQRPLIKHIKLTGELLDGVDVELSPNLTCIIGSRGAGKSTLLEAIREATGNVSNAHVKDSEVWPQTISLDYVDGVGQSVKMQREKNSVTVNRTDPVNGLSIIPIESYGQGDTADTIQHSDENPKVIIDFLDGFLNLEYLRSVDSQLIEQLRSNQSEMNKLRLNLASLEQAKRMLENEKKKFNALAQTKAADIVRYNNALIKEREFRTTLINELNNLVKTYKNILGNTDLFSNVASLTDEDIIVGKEYFQNVKDIVNEFSKIVSAKSGELNSALKEKIEALKVQLQSWAHKESEIQSKIDAKKAELTQQGIPFDIGKINQVSKDLNDYEKRVKLLLEDQKRLTELLKVRKELLTSRSENRSAIFKEHLRFAIKVNKNLKESIEDFFITIKYTENRYSPEFETTLKDLMGWRTSQVPKATIIARSMSVIEFVEAIVKNDERKLMSIQHDGSALLSLDDAKRIIANLKENNKYEDLESVAYDDLPEITVTKLVEDKGIKRSVVRRISQLSLGQQQSVLLGILLLSDSDRPLLIDQPEDNLDSEFIFRTIVSNLRKIKERRQVIIVTHNPNIAVLGDAELIIPLKSTSTHSMVINSGSIDSPETVDVCCQILEGGESAFKQRKTIYGF